MTNKNQKYTYLSGWGNDFETESVKGALPIGQNSPQKCPLGLYAEQLSGSPFTAPRGPGGMARSWLYRILPSVTHEPFVKIDSRLLIKNFDSCETNPNQYRWSPTEIPGESTDFVQGLISICGAGAAELRTGCQILNYVCNTGMKDKAFFNADGEFLIVPQQGILDIQTELGMLEVTPGEIVVIPRGVLFSVNIPDGPSRGYICEVYQSRFVLPNLGPIGANGLANPRDFLYPVAHFEERKCKFTVINKFQGSLFQCTYDHSPFNVVAWHGNYAPYKYDLDRFCVINSVSFDHPDPSIYTVLTAPSAVNGTAVLDFVIFPPRWEAKDHTFRPPYYHRNCMSEYMGIIRGVYEAKRDGKSVPGGSTLHSCMTPHGPDAITFEAASNADISKPTKLENAMAFMFESSFLLKISDWAQKHNVDKDYHKCWEGLKSHFQNPTETK